MWAVIGGTVLLVVAQIVATKTLGEGIGRLARNDIRKNMSGGAENVLARGEHDIVGLNKCSSNCVDFFRRNCGFNRCRGFRYFRERGRGDLGTEFSDGGIHRGGWRRDHQRGRVWMRVEQFSLDDVMVSFSHGHGEKDTMEGGVNESGGNVSYKSMKTIKMKER